MLKKKWITYGELKKRYLIGFKTLKYGVQYWDVTYRPACTLADYKFSYEFQVALIKIKRFDCTYVAITCKGMFSIFDVAAEDNTLVLRVDGILNDIDELDDEIRTAALNKVYERYDEERKKRQEGEKGA